MNQSLQITPALNRVLRSIDDYIYLYGVYYALGGIMGSAFFICFSMFVSAFEPITWIDLPKQNEVGELTHWRIGTVKELISGKTKTIKSQNQFKLLSPGKISDGSHSIERVGLVVNTSRLKPGAKYEVQVDYLSRGKVIWSKLENIKIASSFTTSSSGYELDFKRHMVVPNSSSMLVYFPSSTTALVKIRLPRRYVGELKMSFADVEGHLIFSEKINGNEQRGIEFDREISVPEPGFVLVNLKYIERGLVEPAIIDFNIIIPEDFENEDSSFFSILHNCRQASKKQIGLVNKGNALKEKLLDSCKSLALKGEESWCEQIIRPNPDELDNFYCTYGKDQTHQLIHPEKSTWDNVLKGIQILRILKEKDINVCRINNWCDRAG